MVVDNFCGLVSVRAGGVGGQGRTERDGIPTPKVSPVHIRFCMTW